MKNYCFIRLLAIAVSVLTGLQSFSSNNFTDNERNAVNLSIDRENILNQKQEYKQSDYSVTEFAILPELTGICCWHDSFRHQLVGIVPEFTPVFYSRYFMNEKQSKHIKNKVLRI